MARSEAKRIGRLGAEGAGAERPASAVDHAQAARRRRAAARALEEMAGSEMLTIKEIDLRD